MSCLCQDSEYVVAVRNYITEDRIQLSFHKGDIVRLQHRDGLEAGEMHMHVCLFVGRVFRCTCLFHSTSCCVCVHVLVRMCMCSGKYYGCIVRKKVMLLEELKRDTPEFGGFDSADAAGTKSIN